MSLEHPPDRTPPDDGRPGGTHREGEIRTLPVPPSSVGPVPRRRRGPFGVSPLCVETWGPTRCLPPQSQYPATPALRRCLPPSSNVPRCPGEDFAGRRSTDSRVPGLRWVPGPLVYYLLDFVVWFDSGLAAGTGPLLTSLNVGVYLLSCTRCESLHVGWIGWLTVRRSGRR